MLKKQSTVSLFSIEAEFRSVENAIAEVMWIESLLEELQVKTECKTTIWCDNLSTVHLTANPVL